MSPKLKPLHEQVVVITGASSGIGLATAQMAASRGARVVLVSRNESALQHIAAGIKADGGEATFVCADVGNEQQLGTVAQTAIDRFGGFDTWVNNAGVSIFGEVTAGSDEDHRRLFETNFWGVVYGSLIASRHLRERGGALINVGSVASDLALPLQGIYSASKHAVKGFTDALRMELEAEGAPVSITLIKPAAINTPFTEHARKYDDRGFVLPPPVYPPSEVAGAILHAALYPVRDVYVGGGGKFLSQVGAAMPRAVDWYAERIMMPQQIDSRGHREPEGSLYQAGHDGRVDGDHPGYVMKASLYTRAVRHPMFSSAAGVLAGLACWAVLRRIRA